MLRSVCWRRRAAPASSAGGCARTLARNTETLGSAAPAPALPTRLWGRPVGTLAASVLLGLGLGYGIFRQSPLPVTIGPDGALLASGVLRRALTEQLAASQPADAAVLVGLSYLSRGGNYCRSFALRAEAAPVGIACRQGDGWRIEALSVRAAGEGRTYRTAATTLPPALLQVVEDSIRGETLDQAGEAQAQRNGWHPVP